MKIMYLIISNIRSGITHRRRWVFSIVASFMVVGFVTITSYSVLRGLSQFFEERDANIYKIAFMPGTRTEEIKNALSVILENNPTVGIKVFSPCANTPYTYLIGQNSLSAGGMQVAGSLLQNEYLASNEMMVWMGVGFWNIHKDIKFPYSSIKINEQICTVAGITDSGTFPFTPRGDSSEKVIVTQTDGIDLTLYLPLGEPFVDTGHIDTMIDEEDSLHEEEGIIYGGAWQYAQYSMVMPLTSYMSLDFPVSHLYMSFESPPTAHQHDTVSSAFLPFAKDVIERPVSAGRFGIAQMLALVSILALCLCLLQLTSSMRAALRNRLSHLNVFSVVGCSSQYIILMLMVEALLWQCVGFALSIAPARFVTDMVTRYTNPRVVLHAQDVLNVWGVNVIIASILNLWITFGIMHTLKKSRG